MPSKLPSLDAIGESLIRVYCACGRMVYWGQPANIVYYCPLCKGTYSCANGSRIDNTALTREAGATHE